MGWTLRRIRRDARGAGALVLALVQLVALGVLPAADAVLDIEQMELPLHIESEGSKECAPPHDHVFCQVVRSLAAAAEAPAVSGAIGIAAPVFRLHEPPASDLTIRRFLTRSVGSRAPPLA